MKGIKVLALACTIGYGGYATAQTDSILNRIKISGSVDAYARVNLNTYNRYYQSGDTDVIAPKTAFADKPGFALGMANVVASYEGEKVGAVVDLVYGPRGEAAVFNAEGSSNIINQAYVYWKPNDKLTLTLGQFNTFVGYEVISPVGNFNYSTSYMFTYGPFNHAGIKANYQINDNWSAMVAVMNPNDKTLFNGTGTYTIGGQLGYTKGSGKVFLNALYGDQDGKLDDDGSTVGDTSAGGTFQIDLNGGVGLGEKFYLGADLTYLSTASGEVYTLTGIKDADSDAAGFWGAALYTQYQASEKFGLGLRTEYFSEYEGGLGALGVYDDGDASVIDVTLTADVKLAKSLTIKPEIRYDFASEKIFADDKDGSLQKSLGSFLLAAVYKF